MLIWVRKTRASLLLHRWLFWSAQLSTSLLYLLVCLCFTQFLINWFDGWTACFLVFNILREVKTGKEDKASDKYCDPFLYWFSFWFFIIMAIIGFIFILLICCVICFLLSGAIDESPPPHMIVIHSARSDNQPNPKAQPNVSNQTATTQQPNVTNQSSTAPPPTAQ